MYDPYDRRPVVPGREYPIRPDRVGRACLAIVALVALGVGATIAIAHWSNSDSVPGWVWLLVFFGYPALLAGGVAGVHVWLSGERDRGRIARGIGWGLTAGFGMLIWHLLIAVSSF